MSATTQIAYQRSVTMSAKYFSHGDIRSYICKLVMIIQVSHFPLHFHIKTNPGNAFVPTNSNILLLSFKKFGNFP